MDSFKTLTSSVVVLPVDNIDTDQIIPAVYLKATSKAGLGDGLFSNWRYRADGSPNPDFALNRPESRAAAILLAGDNFGCGSSREHAPWALTAWGFRAVISTRFADIFRNNALKNGLLPVIVTPPNYQVLLALFRDRPQAELTIDLEEQVVVLPDGRALGFPIDPFSKTCLLNGLDELGYLLSLESAIASYEQAHSR